MNNAWVSAQALIFGILLGIPTIFVLWGNQLNLGVSAGLMFAHGKGAIFFGLILPHGLLELTAVYLASAAGLRLGWTIIDPGPRRRSHALAEEGRAAMSIALGLIGVLAVSGAIEGFVTGHVHMTWLRIAIGVTRRNRLPDVRDRLRPPRRPRRRHSATPNSSRNRPRVAA